MSEQPLVQAVQIIKDSCQGVPVSTAEKNGAFERFLNVVEDIQITSFEFEGMRFTEEDVRQDFVTRFLTNAHTAGDWEIFSATDDKHVLVLGLGHGVEVTAGQGKLAMKKDSRRPKGRRD